MVYDATSHNGNAAIVGFLGGIEAMQWRQRSVNSPQHLNQCIWTYLAFYTPLNPVFTGNS